jgi:hypothetical protein
MDPYFIVVIISVEVTRLSTIYISIVILFRYADLASTCQRSALTPYLLVARPPAFFCL